MAKTPKRVLTTRKRQGQTKVFFNSSWSSDTMVEDLEALLGRLFPEITPPPGVCQTLADEINFTRASRSGVPWSREKERYLNAQKAALSLLSFFDRQNGKSFGGHFVYKDCRCKKEAICHWCREAVRYDNMLFDTQPPPPFTEGQFVRRASEEFYPDKLNATFRYIPDHREKRFLYHCIFYLDRFGEEKVRLYPVDNKVIGDSRGALIVKGALSQFRQKLGRDWMRNHDISTSDILKILLVTLQLLAREPDVHYFAPATRQASHEEFLRAIFYFLKDHGYPVSISKNSPTVHLFTELQRRYRIIWIRRGKHLTGEQITVEDMYRYLSKITWRRGVVIED